MGRTRLGVLLALACTGAVTAAYRALFPTHYERTVDDAADALSGVPEPVLLGVATLLVVAIWVSVAVLVTKALYWGWKRIDTQVFRLWDLIMPKSPVVRFAAGVTILLFVGVIGPLAVLQASDLTAEGDDVEKQLGINETAEPEDTPYPTPENETQELLPVNTQHDSNTVNILVS